LDIPVHTYIIIEIIKKITCSTADSLTSKMRGKEVKCCFFLLEYTKYLFLNIIMDLYHKKMIRKKIFFAGGIPGL